MVGAIPVMLPIARSDSFIEGCLQTLTRLRPRFFSSAFCRIASLKARVSVTFAGREPRRSHGETSREQGGLLLDSIQHGLALADQYQPIAAHAFRWLDGDIA